MHACASQHSTAPHRTALTDCAHTSISAPICKVVAPIYDPRLSIQPELVYKAHRSRISRQVCEETVRIRDFRASAQTKTCPPRPTPAGSSRVTHVRHMHSQAPGWTDFQRLQLSDRKANILFLVQKSASARLGSDRIVDRVAKTNAPDQALARLSHTLPFTRTRTRTRSPTPTTDTVSVPQPCQHLYKRGSVTEAYPRV